MAIQTETTYEVKIGETTVDTIGLSNTLDTYTWDEIKDYNYVGSWSECYRQMSHRSPSNTTYIGYASTVGDCPFAASWHGGYTNFNISGYGTSLYNFDATHGIYRKLILLNDSTDNYPTVITVNNRSNFKIITEFDAKKYALEYDAIKMLDSTFYSLYDGLSHQSLKYHTHLGQDNDDDSAILISFRPYFIIEFESTYYCLRADIIAYRTMSASYLTNSGMAQCYNNIADVSNTNSKYTGICEAMENWFSDTSLESAVSVPFIQNANTNNKYYCSQEKYIMKIEFGVNNSGFLVDYAFKTEEDLLLFIAGTYGIHFIVNETIYKPIIQSNFVTGYTDQLDTVSDLDNYTDTNHDMPVTPPEPTPPPPSGDDDYESMTTGFASTLSGCTKYYLMSPLDIVTLIRDYYTRAFAGSTLSNSIISCYLCGLSPAVFISTDTPAPIKIPTVAGQAIFETANSYKAIGAVLNKISVGSISVPRMNNDFHDFSPYTIYEVFIPYCGWISLPDTVAGKHIYVEFHVDVRTMAGKAIVLIGADDGGKATCAEMSMNFGASTPFAVIEAGLERQAAVTAGIQTAIGTAAAITGISSGHNALTVSSIGTAAQGIANGMMSSMANYTQVQGKAGDTSDFANGRQCYLKISWAKTDEVVNNSRFGHTIGYLCNTVGKIKDFKGLTVCANPHVNGIDCTESEKEEIKRLLEEGIIVN